VDVDTNTAANAKQVHDEITRLLQALAEKGWRVTVWPVSEREQNLPKSFRYLKGLKGS
jgi:hypothetical protein